MPTPVHPGSLKSHKLSKVWIRQQSWKDKKELFHRSGLREWLKRGCLYFCFYSTPLTRALVSKAPKPQVAVQLAHFSSRFSPGQLSSHPQLWFIVSRSPAQADHSKIRVSGEGCLWDVFQEKGYTMPELTSWRPLGLPAPDCELLTPPTGNKG